MRKPFTGYVKLPFDYILSRGLDQDHDEVAVWTWGKWMLTRPETEEEEQARYEAWAEAEWEEREANRYTEWSY